MSTFWEDEARSLASAVDDLRAQLAATSERRKSNADLRIIWYCAPVLGAAWHPEVVGDDEDAAKAKARLQKKFRGKGGANFMVKEYVEVKPEPTP